MNTFISPAIRGNASLEAFVDCAFRLRRDDGMPAFWSMRTAFDALLHRDLWERFYVEVVDGILTRPNFDGGREWHAGGLAIFDSDECFLSLRTSNQSQIGVRVSQPADSSDSGVIATRPAPAMLASFSDSPLPLVFYTLPLSVHLEVFDPSCRLGPATVSLAEPWTRIDVDAPRETMEVLSTHSDAWCLLEFSLKPLVAQRWDFNRKTLTPLGATLAHGDSAVLLTMLAELARARYKVAAPEVRRLLQHGDFNVRWSALRCLAKISPDSVAAALLQLRDDPHPFIAAMVGKLLVSEQSGTSLAHSNSQTRAR